MGINRRIKIDDKEYLLEEIFVMILMKFKVDVEVYFGEKII